MRQVPEAIAEFDKATTVAKLRGARERRRAQVGKCEGRKGLGELHPALVLEAKQCVALAKDGRATLSAGHQHGAGPARSHECERAALLGIVRQVDAGDLSLSGDA